MPYAVLFDFDKCWQQRSLPVILLLLVCCFLVLNFPFQYSLASYGPSAQFSCSKPLWGNWRSPSAARSTNGFFHLGPQGSAANLRHRLVNPISFSPASAPLKTTMPSPRPASEPRIGAHYAGETEDNPFLTSCSIFFALQPITFASEEAKVAFTINQLTGRTRLWGTAE